MALSIFFDKGCQELKYVVMRNQNFLLSPLEIKVVKL